MKDMPSGLERFATGIGLGSIVCLGAFLVVDAVSSQFFTLFETYISTKSFGVIAAIPTVAFLYVIGSVMMVLSDGLFALANRRGLNRERAQLAWLLRENNETLNSIFFEVYRRKKALEASVAPLILLALGVALEGTVHAPQAMALYGIGGFVGLLAACLPVVTYQMHKEMNELLKEHDNALRSDPKNAARFMFG